MIKARAFWTANAACLWDWAPGNSPRAGYSSLQGSRLVFYSDGITEATDGSDEEYGADRMRDHVLQPGACAESILADVRAFANGEGLHDDATVIFVRRINH